MTTELVCCETVRNELLHAMHLADVDYAVHWLPAGLHNIPDDLRKQLQKAFDSAACDRLLVVMGICGSAISGTRTHDFEVVLPRADDCISLILGQRARIELGRKKPAYFLTKGWIDGERNIWTEYQYAVEKYGPKLGRHIGEMMFAHYRQLCVIDTGCYALEEVLPLTHEIADTLGLEHNVLPADVGNIVRMLRGPWTEEHYYIFPPNSLIKLDVTQSMRQ